ncbi:LD-carboxypeptidase [Mesotoga sp.]|uniref:S66 peptidase family protein n=1 Tax=Mesotoga sp. TaxID=2053577 RepID=UPI00345EFC8D
MRRVWLILMLCVGMFLTSSVLISKEIRTIFVTAPASFPERSKLEAGVNALRNVGYRVIVGRSCEVSLSSREKANELNDAFANPEYDAIIAARGGYGSYNLLDWLDWEVIASNPKPLVGYSDITALLLSIYFKTGQTTFHGPMVAVELGSDTRSVQNIAAIFNGERTIRFNYQSIPVIEGKMIGRLIPANLSLFQALQGTEYLGSLKDAILVLEDVS